MRFSVIILLSLLLLSCATPHSPAPRLQMFNETDYRANLEDGTAIIVGEAFLTTRGGGIRYGSGCLVQLIPVTPYTTEIFERQFINYERLSPPIDKRLDRYARFTTADSKGTFRFEQVPAGSYYLKCSIYWEVPRVNRFNPSDVYYEETGGAAVGRVTIGDGEQQRVVVTR